jgi:hypothetical protein
VHGQRQTKGVDRARRSGAQPHAQTLSVEELFHGGLHRRSSVSQAAVFRTERRQDLRMNLAYD